MKLRLIIIGLIAILACAVWGYAADTNGTTPTDGTVTVNTPDNSGTVPDNTAGISPVYLPLTFGEKVLKPEYARAMHLDNKLYLPLAFFSTYLHAATEWDAEKGMATIRLGKLIVRLTDGNPKAIWNGKVMPLSYAPKAMSDGFWFPAELLQALGMQVTDGTDGVNIIWKHNYLLFVKSSTYQGRPAITFQTTRPTEQKDFLLSNPDRLVLDLKGVERFPYFEEDWRSSYAVRSIRVNQFSGDLFRMVFDLARSVGYRIIVPNDGSQQVIVVFDALIQKVAIDPHQGDPRVTIDGLAPLSYKTTAAMNPARLIIDIQDARVEPKQGSIKGDGVWVKNIRFSQFDSHQVRIVLDLNSFQSCYIVSSHQRPNHLEIRTQQTIQKIQWVPDDLGGYLRIQSSGQIDGEFAHLKAPERLVLNLQFAKVDPACAQNLSVNTTPLKGVKVTQASSSEVRLEMSLDFSLGKEF
ncbi:MAG TPA: AMIN domain-containing protein, partial [Bacillota bacterium]|nr:AMIN domain-containing protein [Bacillota bacterium]